MMDGVSLSGLFDDEWASPEVHLRHGELDSPTGGPSFSLHFGPEFPCESPASVTLTVLVESSGQPIDTFVVAPFGTRTEVRADTFVPAGKVTLLADRTCAPAS